MFGGDRMWVSLLKHRASPKLAAARFLVRTPNVAAVNAMLALIDSRLHGRITRRQYDAARRDWLASSLILGTGIAGREASACWGPGEILRLMSPFQADLLLLEIASATLCEARRKSAPSPGGSGSA